MPLNVESDILIQRQRPEFSAIELRFEEVVGMMVSPPPPHCDAIIFEASFWVEDEIYYWAETSDWRPESPDRDGVTWISARRVWWRDASEWMGPQLRYLAGR